MTENADYLRNWDVLGLLAKRGSSFSGRERNCVFLNTGGPRFADVSAVTGLDFVDDGRAVGLTDWDQDGDLDMWLANRTAPRLRLVRNDLGSTNRHLSIRLVGSTCNRDAIGARVEVHLDDPGSRRLIETVRAGDGYLTQSTKWVHFGVGQAERIRQLRIRWPGESDWDEFDGLETNAQYQITQGTSNIKRLDGVGGRTPLAAADPKLPPTSSEARVVLTARVQFPMTEYLGFDGANKSWRDGHVGPVLLTFWASWCEPCLRELQDLAQHLEAFEKAGIAIVPLCTDQLTEPTGVDSAAAQELLQKIGRFPAAGLATANGVAQLTELQSWIFYKHRPLPLPCSFLLDADGRLAVIYRGATTANQVSEDVRLLNITFPEIAESALPSTGRFLFPKSVINPLLLVRAHREGGYMADAKKELEDTLNRARQSVPSVDVFSEPQRRFLVEVYRELAAVEAAMGNTKEAMVALQEALQIYPEDLASAIALALALADGGNVPGAKEQLEHIEADSPEDSQAWRMLGQAWLRMKDFERASASYSRGLAIAPDSTELRFDLGVAFQLQGDGISAADQFEQLVAQDPSSAQTANNLAWIYATDADETLRNGARAVELAEQACRLTQNQQPVYLGTLSAAYAEVGRFKEALQTIRQAIRMAKQLGQDALVADLQRRSQLHEKGLPYHQDSRADEAQFARPS